MPWNEAWPPPSREALDLIARVYSLSSALRAAEIPPEKNGVALLITINDAFTLLDHLRGPWRVNVPPADLDLGVPPRPGWKWGVLFGVTLIIEERDTPVS